MSRGKQLFVFVAVTLAFLLIAKSPAWQRLENKGFDLLINLTAPIEQQLPIIIVGIDDVSLQSMQQRWPWPRSVHADLINVLKREGAAVIAFDIIFDQPGVASEDAALAAAIEQAGNVTLAARKTKQESYYGTLWSRQDPLPLLLDAGAAAGLADIDFDADFVVREFPEGEDMLWRVILRQLQARLGDVELDFSPRNNRLIRFLGEDHSFIYVSYYQALEPEKYLPQGIFEDTLVLVGRDSIGSADIGSAQVDTFATPMTLQTGRLTPGVEIHATLVENAFFDSSIQRASYGLVALLIVIVTLICWFGVVGRTPLRSLFLTVLLLLCAAATGVLSFYLFSLYVPFFILLLAPLLIYGGNTVIAYLKERRHRQLMRSHFSLYVPEQIVEELSADPGSLRFGGAQRDITVLFADLAGFTTAAEKLPPEDVARLLNEYFEELSEIIFRHNGTLDKFIGDEVMAFWGAPTDDTEHALHAVKASAEMLASMDKIKTRLHDAGFPFLSMKIGVHSGEALVGNFGSTRRFSYTALGDTVNLASRLVGANKRYHTDILLSAKTAALLEDQFELKSLGLTPIRGKDAEIELFTLEHSKT
ncbi:MAG: adenylate/guanylate cyclase domain-containing protein [Desulfuromonadales bacterium]|nr:adenylate/guanylate cyclase domain-containing protein [Desulfuromonadales bacterium]